MIKVSDQTLQKTPKLAIIKMTVFGMIKMASKKEKEKVPSKSKYLNNSFKAKSTGASKKLSKWLQ